MASIELNKDRKSPTWIITTTDSQGFHRQLNVTREQMDELVRLWDKQKEHWQREQRLARLKSLPVMHIKREIEVLYVNLNQIEELVNEGVITELFFDISRTPTLRVKLSDNHTIVEDFGWLLQDTEGRWCGMDNNYHRMLEHYGKIRKE